MPYCRAKSRSHMHHRRPKSRWGAKISFSFFVLCLLAIPAQARTETEVDAPEPMAGQATDMALTAVPVRPATQVRVSLAGGLLGDWSRGEAEYQEYQALAATIGGWYGMSLPWQFFRYAAVGLDLRATSWLVESVDVPPAISERHQQLGLGTMRLALSAQILDSSTWSHWDWGHIALGVWMRASMPTTTLVLDDARYPKVPWVEALGPAAKDSKAALFEVAGVTALLSLWKDSADVRLSWVPLAWGIASGTADRFFTHIQLGLAGRPWWRPENGWSIRGLELLAEFGLLAAYNEPVYTEHLNAGTAGLAARLWMGPIGLEAGFRFGFGSTTMFHGQWVGQIAMHYRFATTRQGQ